MRTMIPRAAAVFSGTPWMRCRARVHVSITDDQEQRRGQERSGEKRVVETSERKWRLTEEEVTALEAS